MPPLARFAPGLAELLEYKREDASADIKAGLAVAAVAVPVGLHMPGLQDSVQRSVFIQAYCPSWPTRFSARRANSLSAPMRQRAP
jgi:hypothetical protein